jgi:hypothetical protein
LGILVFLWLWLNVFIYICSGTCGVSVAISLADMHYCESNKMEFKRFFGIVVKRTFPKNNQQLIKNQPISPYRLFM